MSGTRTQTTPSSCLSCPECSGRGHSAAFISAESGHRFEPELRCDFCAGSGKITAEQAGWLVRGRQMRNARVERHESLREVAIRLGLTPAAMSAMERGRADPGQLETAYGQ